MQQRRGLTATQAFMVTTTDHEARGVVEDTLAALGRGHLASARATLGRRVETTGQEQSQVTVAGLHVPLGTGVAAAGWAVAERWITGVAGGMPRQSGGWTGMDAAPGALGAPAATLDMAVGAPFGEGGRAPDGAGASPTLSGLLPLSAGGQTEFLLALGSGQASGGAAQGPRWTVWGQLDQQAFGGERSPAVLLPVDGACGAITGATDEDVEYVERFCVLSFHRWPDPAARVPLGLCELTAEYVAAAHAEGPALTLALTAEGIERLRAASRRSENEGYVRCLTEAWADVNPRYTMHAVLSSALEAEKITLTLTYRNETVATASRGNLVGSISVAVFVGPVADER